MVAFLEKLARALSGLVAPSLCMVCEEPSPAPLCDACRDRAEPAPERDLQGVGVVAAVAYAPPFDGLIQRFKYQRRPDLARGLASLLLASPIQPGDLLVPVPLHAKRLAERGYNQSALLANALARPKRARVAARALARVRNTPRQAALARAERLANVEGAFRARRPAAVAGRRVVLVDDVVTTGATAAACIRALQGAGADVRMMLAVAAAGA